MKKILKWIGIGLGGLVGLLVLAVAGLLISTEVRFNRVHNVAAEPLTVSSDAASIAIGKHWAEIHCQSCHGPDLSGGEFFTDADLGYVDASNLTAGQGGVGGAYTDADWVRAIRHGIRKDGTSVFIMPSNDFYHLSDTDLSGVIAYLKSVPPVNKITRPRALSPMAKILFAAGVFPNLLYAETIQHDVRPPAPPPAVNAEYGGYLTRAHGCTSCHGTGLTGGQPSRPGAPPAPNLTPGGDLSAWSEDEFKTALRTGRTPAGRELSEDMPWKGLSKMTDEEMRAVWLYLRSLPAGASTAK